MEQQTNRIGTEKFDDVWQGIIPHLERCPGLHHPDTLKSIPGTAREHLSLITNQERLSPGEKHEQIILEKLIETTEMLSRRYVKLSQKYRNNSTSNSLFHLHRETKAQADKLKTAYFIFTGEKTPHFGAPIHETESTLSELRSLFWAELQNADELCNAAESSPFSALYKTIAADNRQKADVLFSLIGASAL